MTFLLSERAAWITGGNIVVDGGQRYPSARRPPGGRRDQEQRLVSRCIGLLQDSAGGGNRIA